MKKTLASTRPGRLLLLPAALGAFLAAQPLSYGVLAEDFASNYGGANPAWTNGSNEGSGFTAWTLNPGGGGLFLQNSNEGGARTNAINTGGQAFGMWNGNGANPTEAIRGFQPGVWTDGSSLSFQYSFRFDSGARGVTLNGSSGQIFFLTISSSGYAWSGGGNAPATSWAGQREFGEVLSFTFTQNGSNVDYAFEGSHASSPNTVGSVAGTLTSFRVYSAAGGGGGGNDVFFNNLQVIPEPSTYALLIGLGVLTACVIRRRRI